MPCFSINATNIKIELIKDVGGGGGRLKEEAWEGELREGEGGRGGMRKK